MFSFEEREREKLKTREIAGNYKNYNADRRKIPRVKIFRRSNHWRVEIAGGKTNVLVLFLLVFSYIRTNNSAVMLVIPF